MGGCGDSVSRSNKNTIDIDTIGVCEGYGGNHERMRSREGV